MGCNEFASEPMLKPLTQPGKSGWGSKGHLKKKKEALASRRAQLYCTRSAGDVHNQLSPDATVALDS